MLGLRHFATTPVAGLSGGRDKHVVCGLQAWVVISTSYSPAWTALQSGPCCWQALDAAGVQPCLLIEGSNVTDICARPAVLCTCAWTASSRMHAALQDRARMGIADVAAGRHRGCLGLAAILQ